MCSPQTGKRNESWGLGDLPQPAAGWPAACLLSFVACDLRGREAPSPFPSCQDALTPCHHFIETLWGVAGGRLREGRRRQQGEPARPGVTPPGSGGPRQPRGTRCNGLSPALWMPVSLSSLRFLLLTPPFPTRTVWPISDRFLQSYVCPFIIERSPCLPRNLCSVLVKTSLLFIPSRTATSSCAT